MDVTALISEIRFITKTDTDSFSDAMILSGLNLHESEIIMDILRVQTERNTTGNIVKYDLISTNGLAEGAIGYNGEFPFPVDMLRPIRVEASYDAVTWRACGIYDIASNQSSEDNQSQINTTFLQGDHLTAEPSTTKPLIRFNRDSLIIRPLNTGPTVPNGLIIWYEQRQPALVNGTDTPAFDASFHEILVFKGAVRYAQRYPEKYNPLWDSKASSILLSLKEFYKNRFKHNKKIVPSYESFR